MARKYAAYMIALALSVGTVFAQDGAAGAGVKEGSAAKEVALLSVGDKAPALNVAKWVKGTPVAGYEPGKTYVVEFWATWCGPCRKTIPHLTELQKKHGDKVTIIGVTSEDPNNSLDDVNKMVADFGDKMLYNVAWDTGRSTNRSFMEAARQDGIPTAFVVDGTGKVAFIGHPVELDGPLDQIIAGTWDAKAAKTSQEAKLKAAENEMAYMKLMRAGKGADADAVAAKMMLTEYGEDPAFLNMVSWNICDPDAKDKTGRDADLALRAAEKANDLTKNSDPAILDTLAHAHAMKGDLAKAVEIEKRAVELSASDPQMKADLVKSLTRLEGLAAAKK